MPIDTAVCKGDTATLNLARSRIESLPTNYALTFTVGGDPCLYWQKLLEVVLNARALVVDKPGRHAGATQGNEALPFPPPASLPPVQGA